MGPPASGPTVLSAISTASPAYLHAPDPSGVREVGSYGGDLLEVGQRPAVVTVVHQFPWTGAMHTGAGAGGPCRTSPVAPAGKRPAGYPGLRARRRLAELVVEITLIGTSDEAAAAAELHHRLSDVVGLLDGFVLFDDAADAVEECRSARDAFSVAAGQSLQVDEGFSPSGRRPRAWVRRSQRGQTASYADPCLPKCLL